MLFHKLEKFRYKIKAKTFLCENIGPDVKVLVPDVKVLVLDVKVLVPDVKVLVPGYGSTGPGCGSTGPQIWKYWSLDVSNCVRKSCQKS